MIRIRLTDGTFLFGIEAENVRRMKDGQPIRIDLKPMGGTDTLVLMYGETQGDIKRELETAFGHPLPEPEPWPEVSHKGPSEPLQ